MDPTDLFIQGLAKAPDREYGVFFPVSWKKGTSKEDYKIDWKGGVTGDTARSVMNLLKGMDTGAVDPVDVLTAGLGMGSLATRPVGSLGMFGRSGIPNETFREAAKMASKNASVEQIHEATGLWKARGGPFLKEYDDSNWLMNLRNLYDADPSRPSLLPDIVRPSSTELYDVYPELMNVKIQSVPNFEFRGEWSPANQRITINKDILPHEPRNNVKVVAGGGYDTATHATARTLAHEVQHAVQSLESRIDGSNSKRFEGISKALEDQGALQRLAEFKGYMYDPAENAFYRDFGSGIYSPVKEYELPDDLWNAWLKDTSKTRLRDLPPDLLRAFSAEELPYQLYRHNVGEAEARETAQRFILNGLERSRNVPQYDVDPAWLHGR